MGVLAKSGNNISFCDNWYFCGDDMSLARLIKWIGLVALVVGIIGFLLPGQFVYSRTLDVYLTQYGNALFPGIDSNPSTKMLIAKVPEIGLALIGFVLVFWGFLSGLTESQGKTGKNNQDTKKSIQEVVAQMQKMSKQVAN